MFDGFVTGAATGDGCFTGGAGALAGLGLGLGLSAVLVFVVNPQSFHWSMEMHLPVARLAALVGLAFAAAVGSPAAAVRDAAELLDVHVHQLARSVALVAGRCSA